MSKRRAITLTLLIIFFIGLSVLLYPSLSNYWNSKTQSKAIADYSAIMEGLDPEYVESMFAAADAYNQQLAELETPMINYSGLDGYWDVLNIDGHDMMGIVNIDKIGVELPVYKGTSDAVLAVSIGHLQGSSLPVGGMNTHCVVSAHRGLPTAELFTHLDRLEVGDVFTLTVLDRVLTYEVDQIRITEPNSINDLQIVSGEDYCTLLTCTPLGINTHRLLVRGKRIETIENREVKVTSEAHRIDTLIVTPIVALPILFVLIMIVLFKPVKKEQSGDDFV